MPLNCQVIKNIENRDFLGSNRGIYEDCEKVNQEYKSGDLRGCMAQSRIVLEAFVKYMYMRLTGNPPKGLADMLKDTKFKIALQDTDIIKIANEIRNKTNPYHHPQATKFETEEEFEKRKKYEDEYEVPEATAESLEQLSLFLSLAVDVINNKIASERGEVKFYLEDRYNPERDTTERFLVSDLVDVDNRREFERVWAIKGTSGNLPNKRPSLLLKESFVGKVIVFTATNNRTEQIFSAEIGPMQKHHILLEGPEDIPYRITSPTSTTNGGDRPTLDENAGNNGSEGAPGGSTIPGEKIRKPKSPAGSPKSPVNPLPTVSDLEKELAIELLKTQEDYDKEE